MVRILRQTYVTRLLAVVCLSGLALAAQDADLKTILKGVETRYNRAKTLQVSFNESYTGPGQPRRSESGQLTLRKPGRMRWDYTTPAGKLFISDGKQVYLYTPDRNRVERVPLKESEDMHAPLAFLLGKLDFDKEFRDFEMRPQSPGFLVTASAKSDRLPYEKIEMLVTPAFEIRKLIVNGQDHSILAFEFAQEKLNPAVNDKSFKFQMPAGATLVNGDNAQ